MEQGLDLRRVQILRSILLKAGFPGPGWLENNDEVALSSCSRLDRVAYKAAMRDCLRDLRYMALQGNREAVETILNQLTTNSEQFCPVQFFANILETAQRGDPETQAALRQIAAHMIQAARDGNRIIGNIVLRNWIW